jgi:hypothetical protein
MPKRYKVEFTPKQNTAPTSTASFTMKENDPNDSCPDDPRDETVTQERRRAFEKGPKHKDLLDCRAIESELGVKLLPKN